VKSWPVPCSISDIRTFLGFANYHRRFIRNFAEIANPLTRLTKKNAPFVWTTEQQKAFDTLREALIKAPVLDHPHRDAPFILDTDASAYAIGAVLSQVVAGEERVIAYASQTLSKSQRNYCTTHRELLAVVQFTKHFKHFLWGRHFLVRTDHSSLRWLLTYNDADGMVARWLSKLQEFDFSIEHRPGIKHLNADGLSRCHSCKNPQCPGYTGLPQPTPRKSRNTIHSCAVVHAPGKPINLFHGTIPELFEMPLLNATQYTKTLQLDAATNQLPWLQDHTLDDISTAQQLDNNIGPVYMLVQAKFKPEKDDLATHSEETKSLLSRWNALSIINGVLVRTGQTSRVGRDIQQIILPFTLREQVLHQLHDLRVSGHLGIQRTIARVHQKFYWPGLSIDVARWCAACPECSSRKGKPGPGRVPLTSLPTGAPFERIAMDILDTRKRTSKGFQYVLVISDYFTKYTDAFPLRHHTAPVVADILMRRWIVYHGVPKQVHSDQGPEFESALIQSLAKLLGSTKTRTAPYRPQSDGQVERFNRTLLNMLSAFVTDQALDWDDHLPYVCMAYRSSQNSSTGCTPYSMVYGRECTMPIDLMYPDPSKTTPAPACGPEYVNFIRKAIETAHLFARDHLRVAAIRQKRGYDAYAKDRPAFIPGDLVRYYYPPAKQTNKFARPWLGPFQVLERPTAVDYKIKLLSDSSKVRTVHIDTIKPYVTPITPNDTTLPIDYEPNRIS
jgi:transposase InsO family protein